MNMKRMRGRNHRPNGGGGGGGGQGFRNQQNGIPLNRNHVFDSSGPEMRVRGTAQQLYEKYIQLARDASSSGDRVTGEAYYQHAEHYFRIISAINQAQGQPPAQNGENRGNYAQSNGQNPYPPQQNGQYAPNEGNGEAEPQQSARRFEQRPYEPRQPRPEFREPRPERAEAYERPPERQERAEPRFRQEPVGAPIDISSALEAELTAAAEPAGFGEQPDLGLAPAPEARAIPIIPDAPPVAAPAPRPARSRGRPRVVKEEVKTEE